MLTVVQKIRFAFKPSVKNLFTWSANEAANLIASEKSLSFDTLHNSCYIDFLKKLTSINSLSIRIRAKGNFKLKVFESTVHHKRTIVAEKSWYQETGADWVVLDLPALSEFFAPSRLFIEIWSLSGEVEFFDGEFVTEAIPLRESRVLVLIRTYKREELVLNMLKTLDADPRLHTDNFRFVILDGARGLSAENLDAELTRLPYVLVSTENWAGSGLSKTIVEHEQWVPGFKPTELLIMDDDIWLDTESIIRYHTLSCYRKKDEIISCVLLNKLYPETIFEVGARYSVKGAEREHLQCPMSARPLLPNLHAATAANLDYLTKTSWSDYGGFFMLGIPFAVIDKIGLPFPFFLKVDDMEYGVRAAEHGIKTYPYPGMTAWHEPFYLSINIWQEHLTVAHFIVTDAIHRNFSWPQVYQQFSQRFCAHWLVGDYYGARLMLEALDMYFKGPEAIEAKNYRAKSQTHLDRLRADFSKIGQSFFVTDTRELVDTLTEYYKKTPEPRWKRWCYALTLNGRLLPGKALTAFVPAIYPQWPRTFGKRKVLLTNFETLHYYEAEGSLFKDFSMYTTLLSTKLRFARHYQKMKEKWRAAAPALTSVPFWQAVVDAEPTPDEIHVRTRISGSPRTIGSKVPAEFAVKIPARFHN